MKPYLSNGTRIKIIDENHTWFNQNAVVIGNKVEPKPYPFLVYILELLEGSIPPKEHPFMRHTARQDQIRIL